MLQTSRPAFGVDEIFEACAGGIRDSDREQRIRSSFAKVELASRDYSAAGIGGGLATLDSSVYDPLGEAKPADLLWFYDERLVKSSRGRPIYRAIRDGNDLRCALCNVRDATTLDHHLPKSSSPVWAVTPDNLLPACDQCNHTKLASTIPTLNTYFDDLGAGPWLRARIVESTPYVPLFYIEPQSGWSPDLTKRALAHFELYGLQKLYAAQANRLIAGFRDMLREVRDREGPGAVRDFLEQSRRSFLNAEPNGWEVAIFAAGAESDWFCDRGFLS